MNIKINDIKISFVPYKKLYEKLLPWEKDHLIQKVDAAVTRWYYTRDQDVT